MHGESQLASRLSHSDSPHCNVLQLMDGPPSAGGLTARRHLTAYGYLLDVLKR